MTAWPTDLYQLSSPDRTHDGDAPLAPSLPSTDDKLRFLRSRAAHGCEPEETEWLETHMSWVLLAGERALKMKKPVRFPFLDFSTVELRERHCREELRLNRRLAPDVYRRLVAMQWADGALHLVAEERLPAPGVTVDWLVEMQRLPRDEMLDWRIAERRVDPDDIDRLAQTLAAFYRDAPRTRLDASAWFERLRSEHAATERVLLLPGFASLGAGPVLDRLSKALDEHAAALHERVRGGHVVEGHGDLRPEHICLLDFPVVIDCLEFDAGLRQVDPFDELSFLGLECAMAGAEWIGPRIIASVGARLGECAPPALVCLYTANRAALRARLAAAHLLDDESRTPQRWLPLGQRYLQRAAEALDKLSEPPLGAGTTQDHGV
ncbi:MAG: hypothetical protein ROZ64_15625 [Burkholderiaceae bacterium]|nr:hypothetical protein [Burkholderiaceae bacterium]